MKKTMTFAAVHFTVAFSVAWLLTGDMVIGGLVAMVEPLCNTVAYFFHERAWERVRARGAGAAAMTAVPAGPAFQNTTLT